MIVTGLQPTGTLHLGNYLGAIRPLVALQKSDPATFCFIADYHAITADFDVTQIGEDTRNLAAMVVAAGFDTEEGSLFRQSDVPEQVELAHILGCTTARFGWLNRMVQFREKSGLVGRHDLLQTLEEIADASWPSVNGDDPVERIKAFARRVLDEALVGENAAGPSVGLFTYPVLQAADILSYQDHTGKPTKVPVGSDQSQHLNLTVDVAMSFNSRFGETFVVPKPVISDIPRVMSLTDGTKKMSKSDANDMSRINLTDDPDILRKKIKRATTDTALIPDTVEETEGRPELRNLLTIFSAVTGMMPEQVIRDLAGKGYGTLKPALTDAVIAHLEPLQERYREILSGEPESNLLEKTLRRGACSAQIMASESLRKTKTAIGIS